MESAMETTAVNVTALAPTEASEKEVTLASAAASEVAKTTAAEGRLTQLLTVLGIGGALTALICNSAALGEWYAGVRQSGTATMRERVLAALAHLCLVANPVSLIGGVALVIVLRMLAPPQSDYVAAQTQQALRWQALVWVVALGSAALVHLLIGGWLQLLLLPLSEVLIWGSAMLYALVGALACLRGQPFRYHP